jgi:hypothetical protein
MIIKLKYYIDYSKLTSLSLILGNQKISDPKEKNNTDFEYFPLMFEVSLIFIPSSVFC